MIDFTECKRVFGKAYNGANGKKIDMGKIRGFIDDVPYISIMQKEFYKTYISARYVKVILPAYEQVFEQLSQEEKNSFTMQPM